jgi:hypothetical protein
LIVYLDTSAAAKLLTKEAGEPAVSTYLNACVANRDVVLSSTLLETELRRTAAREGLAQSSVTALLDRVNLIDVTRSGFTEAGLLPGDRLGSLDAIHIAVALRASADVLISYDQRQLDAAELLGLHVYSPA